MPAARARPATALGIRHQSTGQSAITNILLIAGGPASSRPFGSLVEGLVSAWAAAKALSCGGSEGVSRDCGTGLTDLSRRLTA
jgi:hypothetical protein